MGPVPKPSEENHSLKVMYFLLEMMKLKLCKGISHFSCCGSGLSNMTQEVWCFGVFLNDASDFKGIF